MQNPDAKMHKRLHYSDVMIQNLKVMDETAITLCKENDIPVILHQLSSPAFALLVIFEACEVTSW